MPQESQIIPVILGQTATGKTSIGIDLAKLMDGEIISVDSRKVYEGLPIGTATPQGSIFNGKNGFKTKYVVNNVVHYLMNFLSPDQPYNAGEFAEQAEQLIDDIQSRGKIPILVGGTGFYFKALEKGLPPLPKADPRYREELGNQIEQEGIEILKKQLEKIDPEAARNITNNDKHKIIRALEVHHLTNIPFSNWKNQINPKSKKNFVIMGLQYPKELLEKRIIERSTHMFQSGMIEETETVLKKGYRADCHALSSFGYREAVQVIQGKINRKEFLPLLIKGTKAYAKRQQTWFRTQVKPAWFHCDDSSKSTAIAMKMRAFCYTRPT